MLFTPAERRLLACLILLLTAGYLITALREVGVLHPARRWPPESSAPRWGSDSPEGSVAVGAGQAEMRQRPPLPVRVVATSPFTEGYLDINRADSLDLVQLPGIGPTLTGRILRMRRERGGFNNLRELLEVKGIGEKRMARLGSFLRISSVASRNDSLRDSCIARLHVGRPHLGTTRPVPQASRK